MSRPKVSMVERLMAFKESILRGRQSKESAEFLAEYNKLLRLRLQLRAVEKGIKEWLKNAKKLSKSAMFLARAVDTEGEVYNRLTAVMEAQLADRTALETIGKKIGKLDQLVRDRKLLATLRYLRNIQTRKTQKLLRKSDIDDESKGLATEAETRANVRYEEFYAELLASIRFVVGEADQNGHCSLISPELSAFKLEQFELFLNCQKIIQGSEKDDAKDLLDEWNQFTEKLQTEQKVAKQNVLNAYDIEIAGVKSMEMEEDQEGADEKEERDSVTKKRDPSARKSSRSISRSKQNPQEDDEEGEESEDDEDDFDSDDELVSPESLGSMSNSSKNRGHADLLREKLAQAGV